MCAQALRSTHSLQVYGIKDIKISVFHTCLMLNNRYILLQGIISPSKARINKMLNDGSRFFEEILVALDSKIFFPRVRGVPKKLIENPLQLKY